MLQYDLRNIGGHVEVYAQNGSFVFSADTMREAMQALGISA